MRTPFALFAAAIIGLPLASACSGSDDLATPATSTGGVGSTGSGDPGCTSDTDCAADPAAPLCDTSSGLCAPLPEGAPIGWRDGSAASVILTVVLEPDKPRSPADLAFHPERTDELWVVNRKDDSVLIITRPGAVDMEWKRMRDPAATHFMNNPPAMAFGAGDTFATCGDGDDFGSDFMGPALFSADPEVFAIGTPDGLGSHLDMLHSTTFCRGIAHAEANVYWVFNSNKSSLDQYDFAEDHGPGNDDHSDGKIFRFAKGAVLGVENVPSHLIFDAGDRQLYVADTGHKRIARLDTMTGTVGASFSGFEPVDERRAMDDAVIVDVVPPGTLEQPSGIELHDGLLYVTDHATSRFHAFGRDGRPVRTLDTGLPPGSLAGLAFGPDGKVYFNDMLTSRVYRIDPM